MKYGFFFLKLFINTKLKIKYFHEVDNSCCALSMCNKKSFRHTLHMHDICWLVALSEGYLESGHVPTTLNMLRKNFYKSCHIPPYKGSLTFQFLMKALKQLYDRGIVFPETFLIQINITVRYRESAKTTYFLKQNKINVLHHTHSKFQ